MVSLQPGWLRLIPGRVLFLIMPLGQLIGLQLRPHAGRPGHLLSQQVSSSVAISRRAAPSLYTSVGMWRRVDSENYRGHGHRQSDRQRKHRANTVLIGSEDHDVIKKRYEVTYVLLESSVVHDAANCQKEQGFFGSP
ncbi:hypothetical protein J6590_006100 [Homalodisca vitripennis]|nr:hypothetical protein J6590_006100 [Homalodisca vitripennis]